MIIKGFSGIAIAAALLAGGSSAQPSAATPRPGLVEVTATDNYDLGQGFVGALAVCPPGHPYAVSGGGWDSSNLFDDGDFMIDDGPYPQNSTEMPGALHGLPTGWIVITANDTGTTAYALCEK